VLAVFHWLEYLGLLGGVGSLVVRRLARMPPRIAWVDPPMHVAFAAALAGGLGLLVATPGWAVGVRVAAEGAALLLCIRGVPFVGPPAVFATAALSVTGHASGAGAMFADALHTLSAAMWGGGVLALASLRPPDGWRAEEARDLLARFGRIAFIAFGITALTGLLRATEQLHDLSDLWTTGYGVVLALKVAGVGLMLGLSLVWRRGRPVAGLDAGVAVLVVGATALLAAFPIRA
jgi:putative copper export protein